MNVSPKNRHLLVELVEDEQEERPAVLLPDDYKPMKEFSIAKVLAVHKSVEDEFSVGNHIVAIEGEEHYLLQANYVLCEVLK